MIGFFSLAAFAQEIKPSPTPDEENDVVKISTNLIQVDVTVTDKSGKIVTDLRQDEIEIYENGKKQDISNFSFISNVRPKTDAPKEKVDAQSVLPPPSVVKPEKVRRTIALVVDDLTLSFESTYYVRRALKKFVDEQMQEGDLVAIVRTGAGIGALQQFTTDKRQLHAAIERVRWNASGAGNIGAFSPIEATPLEQAQAAGAEISEEQVEAEREFLRGANAFREDVFATGTLGAINFIVRGMRDLPGRKSIMLLSDGFSLFSQTSGGFADSTRVLESLRRLVDLANRASVVVYTMDARGLQVTGITAADNTGSLSADAIEGRISDRRNQLLNTQEGLRYLAAQTGGLAIINNNDLSGGIRKILDDQSYYLVGYQPDDETFNPQLRRFNKLEVKIKRPGTKVRYRSGFFGLSDEQIEKPNASQTVQQRMTNALISPFAVSEISLRLNALFGNNAATGSFVRAFLHVKASDLKFTYLPDGNKKAEFDIWAVGFGDNGAAIEQIGKSYTLALKKDGYDVLLKEGFVYDFSFPFKKAGAYQLRVAIRDRGTEKIGSANQFVEVPNLKKGRLTISGVVLESIPYDAWLKASRDSGSAGNIIVSNPLGDTAQRRFKRGTVLNYGAEIFNAKTDASRSSNLVFRTRIFRDGQVTFEGKPQPVAASSRDPSKTAIAAAISLGTEMSLGDYVLQIVVTDNLAKEKRKIATQFVQFEVIE